MKLPSALLASLLLLSGCTVGPNYHQPTSATAPAFKESAVVPPPDLPGGGWKQVTPNDSAIRPNWWEIYQDPQLNKLEEQVAVSNQTLKASYEQFMQARAAVQFYRSQYFPLSRPAPQLRASASPKTARCMFPGARPPTTTYSCREKFPGSLISGATFAGKWNRSGLPPKPQPLTWRMSI